MEKKNKFPIYKITLLEYDHFPVPVYKDDIIIFSDKNEEVFKSYTEFVNMTKELDKYQIKYKVRVE